MTRFNPIPWILFVFTLWTGGTSMTVADSPLPERGVCSHRGFNYEYPENTLPAFEAAVRLGAEMIEFDVKFTKDRQIVILHDWAVDRTSNGSGNIIDLTFEEVRRLDFGSWKDPKFAGTLIPTLDETLAVMPRNIWLNIHISVSEEIEQELGLAVAKKVVEEGRTDQAFIACDRPVAEAIHSVYPEIKICNMSRLGGGDIYIENTLKWKSEFIQLCAPHPTPDQIQRLKDAGVKINYFGSNDPDEIRELFELGVEFPLVDNLPVGQQVLRELSGKE